MNNGGRGLRAIAGNAAYFQRAPLHSFGLTQRVRMRPLYEYNDIRRKG